MKLLALCLALFAVAACGSKAKSPTSEPPAGTPLAWADMNHEQREDFMEETVLPTMKDKFIGFDAAEFGEMNCKTCHGAGADDGKFEMPNPELFKLDFANMDKLSPEEQAAAKFMHDVVVPEMATMLGEQPYDPATQQGFGCTDCHTTVDAK